MRTTMWLACAAVALAGAGCASIGPSPELVTARRAYAAASQPGMYPAAAPMLDAQRALTAAEYAHTYSPQSVRARHLAYIATRDAQIAMAQGEADTARAQADVSKREYSALLENTVSGQRMALAQAAANGPRFTANGTVSFETNEATLLPETKQTLDKLVPKISKLPAGQAVVLVGHTDATGEEQHNDNLSKARADAVRSYLVNKGARADQIVSIGKGENQPVASNTSQEGRADNRRVDILIRQDQTARADVGGRQP